MTLGWRKMTDHLLFTQLNYKGFNADHISIQFRKEETWSRCWLQSVRVKYKCLYITQVVSLLLLSAVSTRADLPFGEGHSHDHDHSAPLFQGAASSFSFSRGGRQQDFFNSNLRSVRLVVLTHFYKKTCQLTLYSLKHSAAKSRKTGDSCCSGWSGLQWVCDWPGHWLLLRGEGGDGD